MQQFIIIEIIGTLIYFIVGFAGLTIWSSHEWSNLKEYRNMTQIEKISNNVFGLDFKVILAVILYLIVFAVLGNVYQTMEMQIVLFFTLLAVLLLAIILFVIFTFIKLRYTFKVRNN